MTVIASCISDVRTLRIPNAHILIIFITFVFAYIAAPESFGPWWGHLGALGIVLAVTYGMFCFGLLGAGDAKLGAVLALWVGLPGLLFYMFYMALAGGILGAAALVVRRKRPFKNPLPGSWVAEVQAGKNAVPYGVAISFGAWAGLLHTGFLHHQLDELFRIIH